MSAKVLIQVLKFLPKNAISYLTGALVRMRLPYPLSFWAGWCFARFFGINLSEAEFPLAKYATIEDLFTRRLRPGIRPVFDPDYCSPADGTLVVSAPAKSGKAVQVKGIDYPLDELVYGRPDVELRDQAAWYTTIYLAPHNYHRCHFPVGGTLTAMRHIPGALWPVNKLAVAVVPQLFVQNERLVFDIKTPSGGRVWSVMVGALNVGRVQSSLMPNFVTNASWRRASATKELSLAPKQIAAGDEMGTFMLGSTVVVVMDRKAQQELKPMQIHTDQLILMGRSLRSGLQS